MPANLNALIRYKTINNCLYGGGRKWSIKELISACTEALGDSRGRYGQVSERTIRDDIRVMRSDILGFNAPIVQIKGLYFYSDPGYSIMSINISDSELLDQVVTFLKKLKKEISHPELEIIIERLMKVTSGKQIRRVAEEEPGREAPSKILKRAGIPARSKPKEAGKGIFERIDFDLKSGPPTQFQSFISFSLSPVTETTWGDIFRLIK